MVLELSFFKFLTSALVSRPKNMSEEIAFAFANFCLASLDSDTGADTSAFLLLGSLDQTRDVTSELITVQPTLLSMCLKE